MVNHNVIIHILFQFSWISSVVFDRNLLTGVLYFLGIMALVRVCVFLESLLLSSELTIPLNSVSSCHICLSHKFRTNNNNKNKIVREIWSLPAKLLATGNLSRQSNCNYVHFSDNQLSLKVKFLVVCITVWREIPIAIASESNLWKFIFTSIYPWWSGSSSSIIKAAYSAACFLRFPSLFAEALKTITFSMRTFRNLTQTLQGKRRRRSKKRNIFLTSFTSSSDSFPSPFLSHLKNV